MPFVLEVSKQRAFLFIQIFECSLSFPNALLRDNNYKQLHLLHFEL